MTTEELRTALSEAMGEDVGEITIDHLGRSGPFDSHKAEIRISRYDFCINVVYLFAIDLDEVVNFILRHLRPKCYKPIKVAAPIRQPDMYELYGNPFLTT